MQRLRIGRKVRHVQRIAVASDSGKRGAEAEKNAAFARASDAENKELKMKVASLESELASAQSEIATLKAQMAALNARFSA